ncbi:MAG: DUF6599 family protein [Candidatus Aminicenantales bacterium]
MRRVFRPGLAVLLLVLAGKAAMSASQDTSADRLKSFLPGDVLGWKAEDKDQLYDPQTIFDYIDGAGEIYRAYDFKALLSRRLRKPGNSDIVIDFFDMGSAHDAFGVFTNDLEGEAADVGQDATYNGGLLSFWKDRYFVAITAEAETAETKAALFAAGGAIAAAIQGEGRKPALLNMLPAEFADKKIVHYLHNHIILNRLFFVDRENVLDLDPTSEAVLAKPGWKGRNGILLLIKYPGPKRASEAFEKFARIAMPGSGASGLFRSEDNKWTGATVREDLIAVVFGAPSAETAKEILAKVEQRRKTGI